MNKDIKKEFFENFVDRNLNIDTWDEGSIMLLRDQTQELWGWIESKLDQARDDGYEKGFDSGWNNLKKEILSGRITLKP